MSSLTRQKFREHAKPQSVSIAGVPLFAMPKEFSTGSLGWYATGKISVQLNGEPVECQVGLNITVKKSKELPQDKPAERAGGEFISAV